MRKGTDQRHVTGMSSAQSRRLARKAGEAKSNREFEKKIVAPGIEMILEWIKQEKAEVVNLEKIVLNVSDQDLLRDQIMARQLHLTWLNKAKARAEVFLRVPTPRNMEDVDE